MGDRDLPAWHAESGDLAQEITVLQLAEHRRKEARVSLEQAVADAKWLVRETPLEGAAQRTKIEIRAMIVLRARGAARSKTRTMPPRRADGHPADKLGG